MRTYLVAIAFVLLPGFIALSLSALFLVQSDEFLSIANVVQRQMQSDEVCIYHSGHGDDVVYKQTGYEVSRPSVVAIGSSRAMQFRERLFTSTFYNAGIGQVSSAQRLEEWTERLLALHKPDLAIIAVDYWWFHSENVRRIDSFTPENFTPAPRIQPRFFMSPIKDARRGMISVGKYINIVRKTYNKDGLCRIGQQAALEQSGYGPDGSFYYGTKISDPMLNETEWQFAITLDRLSSDPQGNSIDMNARVSFERTLKLLRDANVSFVVVMPPMAPSVFAAMQSGRYDYGFISQIDAFIKNQEVPYIDASDALAYGSSDCEFPDGRHGGDVTYGRIAKKIYDELEWTRPFIDIATIDAIIKQSAGLVMDPDPRVYRAKETDVLKIGCVR